MSNEPHVVGNSGTLELRPDGALAFTHWRIEGQEGGNPGLAMVDAIIALLRERRDEIGRACGNVGPLTRSD